MPSDVQQIMIAVYFKDIQAPTDVRLDSLSSSSLLMLRVALLRMCQFFVIRVCVIGVAVVLQRMVSKDIIDVFSVCIELFRPQHRTVWYSTTKSGNAG